MSAADLIPILLLPMIGMTFGAGITMAVLVRRRVLHGIVKEPSLRPTEIITGSEFWATRPSRWAAVRTENVSAVQTALRLHDAKPCSWRQALAGDEKLFIAPPINGWILIFGSDLPDPSDDIDACFHFVTGLSKELGEVQLFNASPVLHDHAWIRAEGGRVLRGYAGAGQTLWNQGRRTRAELQLGIVSFEYGESAGTTTWEVPDAILSNVDKIPSLAARWSLDPATVDQEFLSRAQGVAGQK